jgi:hypothetical protein
VTNANEKPEPAPLVKGGQGRTDREVSMPILDLLPIAFLKRIGGGK